MTEQEAITARKHIHIWEYYKKTSTILNLSPELINDLEPIYTKINGGTKLNRSCQDCLSDMIKVVFSTLTQYDKTHQNSVRVEAPRERRPRIQK